MSRNAVITIVVVGLIVLTGVLGLVYMNQNEDLVQTEIDTTTSEIQVNTPRQEARAPRPLIHKAAPKAAPVSSPETSPSDIPVDSLTPLPGSNVKELPEFARGVPNE